MIATVAIPTYNRAGKLLRLLRELCSQIEDNNLTSDIKILVSDNNSTDDTSDVLRSFHSGKVLISHIRNSTNIGFDGNISRLYDHCDTPYVVFFRR